MGRDSNPKSLQAEPQWEISFKFRDVDVTIPRSYIEVAGGPVEPDGGKDPRTTSVAAQRRNLSGQDPAMGIQKLDQQIRLKKNPAA